MSKIINYFIFTLLIVCSTKSIAEQTLKVGVGNFPPFFIESGKKGIFIEIIDEIFKQLPEYKVEYIFMSNSRILHEINYGKSIDVACNIFPSSKLNAYLSVPIFRFRDVAISKKSSKLIINNINDLRGKSIAAYQGATELLGDEFKQIAKKNHQYSEHAHPKDTTNLMISGKKDIRVGDINIFWNDLNNIHYDNIAGITQNDFSVHYLWPDVYSHMAFKEVQLKNLVDEIIKELKSNGTIKKIYSRYEMQ
ncbi:ABC transporter substrate-binding protein [Colwellia sp. BRX10-3]|uniref:substrate-binding periplasmic protein n=1 Tax=Colwellia sp. BRX10-3 TaxID=2759844 RepID=UPI0015F469A1|nr:ABC transporter substrate-binding protein [Colwellia sp. BRX10-3]MBA6391180.1 ABC transporter substrate-binding protein [Colwellia sp. BRX10-3]